MPPCPVEPPLVPAGTAPTRRLLVVGWEGADWNLLHPLLDAGQLPVLGRLVAEGALAELSGVAPAVPIALREALLTGHGADRHGLVHEQLVDPATGSLRGVHSGDRRVRTFWRLLAEQGRRCHVVNAPVTHPASPLTGITVSDRFAEMPAHPNAAWDLAEGAVHPPAWAETLAGLRLAVGELEAGDLLPFVPTLAQVDQATDRRPMQLGLAVASTASVHAAATLLAEQEPWDVLTVWYRGAAEVLPQFLPWHGMEAAALAAGDRPYPGVVARLWAWHDQMLGRLLELAGPETTVAVVSPYGWAVPPGGAGRTPGIRATGMLVLHGPGVRRDQLLHGASVLDLVPTLLGAAGLPAALDQPGRVLTEAFVAPAVPPRIPTWETTALGGATGPDWSEHEAVRFLAGLGLPTMTAAEQQAQAALGRERDELIALSLVEAGRWAEAEALLAPHLSNGAEPGLGLLLYAYCLLELGRTAECRVLAERTAGHPACAGFTDLLLGWVAEKSGDAAGARRHFQAAAERGPRTALLEVNLARSNLRLGQLAEAEALFRRTLELAPDDAGAAIGLAQTLLTAQRPTEAVEPALLAVTRRHRWPEAHHLLGCALAGAGRLREAVVAFETSLTQRPSVEAHRAVAAILALSPDGRARAAEHQLAARQLAAARRSATAAVTP